MNPELTVGYSCLGEDVANIRFPDVGDDVEMLVAVQGELSGDLPAGVRFVAVPGHGVARSRNAVIDAATGRFLLFCDDDVVVNMAGVLAGVRHLETTGRAIVLGGATDEHGRLRKAYPRRVARLTRFNSAKAATFEMLIDVAQVRRAGLRFDERFGAGADLHLGDEYIFVTDLLAVGLTGDAIPEVFGTHPGDSSGDRWGTDCDTHARAVVLNHVFGRAAPVARVLFAVKQWRRIGDWRRVLRFVFDTTVPPARRGVTLTDGSR